MSERANYFYRVGGLNNSEINEIVNEIQQRGHNMSVVDKNAYPNRLSLNDTEVIIESDNEGVLELLAHKGVVLGRSEMQRESK